MIKDTLNDAINEQINAELYSAYLYLSMSADFESKNLPGFANWMRVQFEEEQFHAMKMFDYVNERGGKVIFKSIAGPEVQWETPLAAFEAVLKHEIYVTSLINKLMDLAIAESDHAAKGFLQWFVDEQVEEEANAEALVAKVKMVEGNPHAMFMIDKDLAARVFTPPAAE